MDNATRKELLYKARAAGYPGSILDVFANYDQGRDLIAEFQQQQQMQQQMQMSDMAAQQVGMQQAPQQPQQQMQPQMPVVPSSPTPAPNFTPPQPPAPIGVQSQDTPVGIVSGQSGPNQGRAIFATGGFTEQDPPDWRSMLNYKNAAAKQNLVGNVRKVEKPTSVAETTKPVSTPKASAEWKGKSGKQIIEEAKAQEAYNALPEEMKRRDTLTADTRSDAEKFARRTWTAVSQPMETITALNKGYDIPSGYMGMYDAYEGYDVKSPMNF